MSRSTSTIGLLGQLALSKDDFVIKQRDFTSDFTNTDKTNSKLPHFMCTKLFEVKKC